MDFTGSLTIPPRKTLDELVNEVATLLDISFVRDTSGRYEEFPVFVGVALGVEIAVLGIPEDEDLDDIGPVTEYSLLVQSIIDAPDDDTETDLSVHICSILQAGGIACSIGNA